MRCIVWVCTWVCPTSSSMLPLADSTTACWITASFWKHLFCLLCLCICPPHPHYTSLFCCLLFSNFINVSCFYGFLLGIFCCIYLPMGSANATKHTSPKVDLWASLPSLLPSPLTSILRHPVLVSGLSASSSTHPGLTLLRS